MYLHTKDGSDPMTHTPPNSLFPVNILPSTDELPEGFLNFLRPLHEKLRAEWHALLEKRRSRLILSETVPPDYDRQSEIHCAAWRVPRPSWIIDQRNQMTGPADDGDLVVKMLNSGAPGVMIDLEDSMANRWPNLKRGIENAVAALHGTLTYEKKGQTIAIKDRNKTIVFTRVRGLHLNQWGVLPDEPIPAALFDAAMLVYLVDGAKLAHPLSLYIPKTENPEEAQWWRTLLRELSRTKGWYEDTIKCMALVESHTLAYGMDEFSFYLREHLIGLNLGRWDYMASLIHHRLADPDWVLPDRNTIPHDVPFFQNLRILMPNQGHSRGLFIIGGMTALYPSRVDAELNTRALAILETDKKNESGCGFDGAWTGHPDQNGIALAQFPYPNQLGVWDAEFDRYPDLRPLPTGVGNTTLKGTKDAIRTSILYRYGVLNGKGASLINGYMEDLATDRIYRLMVAQRLRHGTVVTGDDGNTFTHDAALVTKLFDDQLSELTEGLPENATDAQLQNLIDARRITESMIRTGEFDPS